MRASASTQEKSPTTTTKLLRVGLTGGIGSGKTHVGNLLQTAGYPVYEADAAAKRLMETDEELMTRIQKLFGEEAYLDDGELNRAHLAATVFPEPKKLQRLNNLVHPAVRKDFMRWSGGQAAAGHRLIFQEAAILYESGGHKQMDAMLTVYAPRLMRMARIKKRDGLSEADIAARMARQWSDAKKIRQSDFVIYNDGQDVRPQIDAAIKLLLARLD